MAFSLRCGVHTHQRDRSTRTRARLIIVDISAVSREGIRDHRPRQPKDAAYVDGGPAHPGAASLPAGSYYVRVTNPSDSIVLGTSVGSGNDTAFVVAGGEPAGRHRLNAILIKGSDATPGYDDTDNAGGENKVWVRTDSTFLNNSTKTDNFKVRGAAGGTGQTADLRHQHG